MIDYMDFFHKYGFEDGDAVPLEAFGSRAYALAVLEEEFPELKFTEDGYDIHNPCMISIEQNGEYISIGDLPEETIDRITEVMRRVSMEVYPWNRIRSLQDIPGDSRHVLVHDGQYVKLHYICRECDPSNVTTCVIEETMNRFTHYAEVPFPTKHEMRYTWKPMHSMPMDTPLVGRMSDGSIVEFSLTLDGMFIDKDGAFMTNDRDMVMWKDK